MARPRRPRLGRGAAGRCARDLPRPRDRAPRVGARRRRRRRPPASSLWPTPPSSRPPSASPTPRHAIRSAPGIGAEPRIDQSEERRLYAHYGLGYSEDDSGSGLPSEGRRPRSKRPGARRRPPAHRLGRERVPSSRRPPPVSDRLDRARDAAGAAGRCSGPAPAPPWREPIEPTAPATAWGASHPGHAAAEPGWSDATADSPGGDLAGAGRTGPRVAASRRRPGTSTDDTAPPRPWGAPDETEPSSVGAAGCTTRPTRRRRPSRPRPRSSRPRTSRAAGRERAAPGDIAPTELSDVERRWSPSPAALGAVRRPPPAPRPSSPERDRRGPVRDVRRRTSSPPRAGRHRRASPSRCRCYTSGATYARRCRSRASPSRCRSDVRRRTRRPAARPRSSPREPTAAPFPTSTALARRRRADAEAACQRPAAVEEPPSARRRRGRRLSRRPGRDRLRRPRGPSRRRAEGPSALVESWTARAPRRRRAARRPPRCSASSAVAA